MTIQLISSSTPRLLLGLGVTGQSVARYWQRQGIPYVAADTRAQLAEDDALRTLLGAETPAVFGDLSAINVVDFAELIVSPGIALEHPLVAKALAASVTVKGDIDLFCEVANAPVVGITGSNGKSTVTTLLGDMIASCSKRVAVGGNLGTPALDLLSDDVDFYVLELSSFQLERAQSLNLAAATVLNVSADHLDRHGSLPAYHQAKHRIFRGARAVAVNRLDPLTQPLIDVNVPVQGWRLGEPDLHEFGVREVAGRRHICLGRDPLLALSDLPLAGEHNVANALAALALGSTLGLATDDLVAGLRLAKGLPHRCEPVIEQDGVRWIDDSKGTNVGATLAALQGLGGVGNVILIAGGVGKGQDFSVLADAAEQHCRRVLTLGESARDIEVVLGSRVPVQRVPSLEQAVVTAAECAQPGDVVMLSPACASFDMFDSYVARGNAFKRAVLEHAGAVA